jgi:hypothetical protein
MNINNITEGLIVKNYKEMCILLNQKEKGGDSKKAQLKEWATYFNYEKDGNKFVIKEIYDMQLEKEDGRSNNKGGNNSIYAENIDRLILHMCSELYDSKYNYIDLNANEIMKRLKMVNENYKIGRNNINQFSRYLEVPIETIFDFYNSTHSKNKQILESGLNRLSGRCLIKWTRTIKVCTTNRIYRNATDGEIEAITELEQLALEELNLENKKDVFLKGKWEKFNDTVNSELVESLGILFYFYTYHIITTEKFRNMLLDERDKDEIEFRLNQDIHFSCIKSAIARHDKIYDKYNSVSTLTGKRKAFGVPHYNKEKNRISNDYINDSKIVANVCIDIFTDVNLENKLKNVENNKYTYNESTLTETQKEWLDLTQDFDWDELFK